MNAALLRSRFERALRLSLLAAVPAAAACGGGIVTTGTDDAGADAVSFDSGKACSSSGIPVTAPSCGYSVTLSGDVTKCGFPTDGGQIAADVCSKLCGPTSGPATTYCYWNASSPGTLECGGACVGRRPSGLSARTSVGPNVVAEHFARAAYLEAASVDAFEILHDELVHHRAPADLRRSALEARADEVRHARIVGAIAERFGAVVERPTVVRGPMRDLEAIAIENAMEGCVRETWGALLATWQADHAKTPRVRAAMQAIAREEAEHALLGLRIARWIDGKLDDAARARVAKAHRDAVADLLAELAIEPDETLREEAGLPTAIQSHLLARSLFSEISAIAA